MNNMPVSWNNKEYRPEQIVEKVESSRETGSDGKKVGFIGWGFDEFAALVYSMLDFSNDIPEIDARGLVLRAIFNSGTKGAITVKSLLAEINKLEKEYQSLPTENYVLVSSISINPSWGLNKIKMGNALIVFESSLPTKYRKETEALIKNAKQLLFADLPTNYLSVRVHVSAKSINHAADQALDALDFTRGIWNWILNRRHFRRMTWASKPDPVNKIILGPLHTLHKPSGELATTKEVWWYEPSYLGAIMPFSPKLNELDSINKSFNHVKKTFTTHKYPQVIHTALIRYTRALDERDWTTAFIKLWSILEQLTDTGRANYDTTIQRTAFLYQEREYHLQVLQHLRKYRNSSIHLDKGNSETEIYLYQLKNYVETLMGFHINNKFGFESIQEAAEFLSLPYEEEALKNQIKKRNLARKFRGYTRKGG